MLRATLTAWSLYFVHLFIANFCLVCLHTLSTYIHGSYTHNQRSARIDFIKQIIR
jgi:ATP-binding cassette subfamily B (MDR/TAP) protein 1